MMEDYDENIKQMLKNSYNEGIMVVCEKLHKHCLEKGMEVENHTPYTEMIVFLNNNFGHLRKDLFKGD